jgi:hypothetical protein
MGASGGFSKASWGVYIHKFPASFGKAICSSHVAVKKLLHTTARGFMNILENLIEFCRSKIKLVSIKQTDK